MRFLILFTFLSLNVLSQTQKEVEVFHNQIMNPYNDVAMKLSAFTASALKQSPNAVLIVKRNDVVAAVNNLKKAVKEVKPIKKDFTLLAEVKKCAVEFDAYVQNNLMTDNLESIPKDARGNIQLIRKYQAINKKFETMGEQVVVRQKKLFAFYKFKVQENELNKKIIVQREAMNYYYTLSIAQFKVQAQVDDLIDAHNKEDAAKMKVAKTKGIQEVNKALAELGKTAPFYGDPSIKNDSEKILKFYQLFLTEKVNPMIKLHMYPKDLPNEKVDAYNETVDEANSSLNFYNELQSIFNESNVVSTAFFKKHLN